MQENDFELYTKLYDKIMFEERQQNSTKDKTYRVCKDFQNVKENIEDTKYKLYVVVFQEQESFLNSTTNPKFYVKYDLTQSQNNELPATLKILKNQLKKFKF